MSQDTILEQFKKYIDLSHEQSHGNILADIEKATLKNNQDTINQLKNLIKVMAEDCRKLQAALDKGHCFGLSLIHGAMDEVGKLPWWEAALVAVANWDGEEESLDQVITLTPQTPPIKLKTLFERVLSYVVFHQAKYNEGFKIENLDQPNLLLPEEHYFEILDDKDIKKIKQRKITSGYLTSDQLLDLLKENDFTQTISLIHSSAHTIRVYYKEGKWVVYDPNYDHTSLETIHKEFDNKEDLAEEIFRILGHSIAIEIATCNPSKVIELPTINSLSPEEAAGRLEEFGLHMIGSYYTTDVLSKFLTLASQAETGATRIMQALAAQDPYDDETGLHILAYYTPHVLPHVLTLARQTEEGPSLIAEALAAQNQRDWSGLQMVVRRAPHSLSQMLALAGEAEEGPNLIAEVLAAQDEGDWTGLQTVAHYTPHILPQVLTLMSKAEDAPDLIAEALAAQNQADWSGLQMVVRHVPSALPQMLALASEAEEGPNLIVEALAAQNDTGWNGLQMVARFAPHALTQILTLANEAEDAPDLIAEALATENKEGWTGWQMIARYAPQSLKMAQALCGTAVSAKHQDQMASNAANDVQYHGSAKGLFSPAGKNLNSTHVRESLEMNLEKQVKFG